MNKQRMPEVCCRLICFLFELFLWPFFSFFVIFVNLKRKSR